MANDTKAAKAVPGQKRAPAKKAAAKKAPAKKATPRAAAATPPPPAPAPPQGWYPDPNDPARRRYWDGETWVGGSVLVPDGTDDTPAFPAPDPTGLDDSTTHNIADETITFRGRTMRVVLPEPEQLVVWQTTIQRLQALEDAIHTPPKPDGSPSDAAVKAAKDAPRLIGRALKIIQTVLVHEVDRDWLEDLILDGELKLMGAVPIIIETVNLYAAKKAAAAGQAAPRTGPTTTARRRR